MSKETRWVPLYERGRTRIAGLSAALKAGDDATKDAVTWLVQADSLAGQEPEAGGYLRDTAGNWWSITEVAPLKDGSYPLKCSRWKEGA